MNIAVTGANGHVGGNLCRELVRQGHSVKALVYSDDTALKGVSVQRISGDLSKPTTLDELCKDTEVVIHLAALISISGKKQQLESTNVQGTLNLIGAIRRSNVRRLIHFSSIHALDHFPLDLPMDESRPLVEHATMMYESTKAKGDRIVLDNVSRGLDAVILNPTAILGPYDYKPSLMGQVLLRLYNGRLPALVPGGYDWVDVRDIVQATIAAISDGKKGERYILSGRWTSVKELAMLMEEVTGKKMVRMILPTFVAKIGVPFIRLFSKMTGQHPLYTYQSLDVLMQGNRMISNAKARKELGFSPRPLKETLLDSITWFKENNFLE
jgi:dihydroflavonol-4-reductase